jgi:hypothetical protein
VLRRTPVRLTRLRSLVAITLLIGTGCGSNAGYDDDDGAVASPTADPTVAPTDARSGAQDTIAQDTIAQDTIAQDTIAQDTIAQGSGVPEALRFQAPLVGGGEIDMSTLADQPVVLWFWAPY